MNQSVTFVAAVNNEDVFRRNLLASPLFQTGYPANIVVQRGFSSAARAYNDALDRCDTELIVFCHQDITLPERWSADLERALSVLAAEDPNWGVLGCYGETLNDCGRGYIYSSGRGITGKPFDKPAEVQTLDEIVLILRKSSRLRFDDELPNFHFYGTDICMRAAQRGMKSYAISAFCVHNTQQTLVLPPEFYECSRHVRRVWKRMLPIQTTCVRLTRSNLPVMARRARELYLRHVRGIEIGGARVDDIQSLLRELSLVP